MCPTLTCLAMAFVGGVDIGYQPAANGGLQLIVQIDANTFQSLRENDPISVVVPPEADRCGPARSQWRWVMRSCRGTCRRRTLAATGFAAAGGRGRAGYHARRAGLANSQFIRGASWCRDARATCRRPFADASRRARSCAQSAANGCAGRAAND